jgi:hypothetical protein
LLFGLKRDLREDCLFTSILDRSKVFENSGTNHFQSTKHLLDIGHSFLKREQYQNPA